jgi:hypothetical protein
VIERMTAIGDNRLSKDDRVAAPSHSSLENSTKFSLAITQPKFF